MPGSIFFNSLLCTTVLAAVLGAGQSRAQDPWVIYKGADGPGMGKHIVLVSGDEEYRSEEALPQLGKILAQRHGFTCTVLFAINPEPEPSIRITTRTSPVWMPSMTRTS